MKTRKGLLRLKHQALIECLESRALLTAGSLDSAFGMGGTAREVVGAPVGIETASASVVQTDGKVLVAGNSLDAGGVNTPFVYRYNSDGSLDAFFGDHGRVAIAPDSPFSKRRINAMALQGDGQIILAGSDGRAFLAYRLNGEGSVDESFDGDGVYRSVPTGILSGDLRAAIVLPDGRILLAGTMNQYTGRVSYDVSFVRLLPDGTPDASFGGGGIKGYWFTDAPDSIETMALLPDGAVLAAGTAGGDFLLMKLTPSGALDETFGDGVNPGTLTNLGHRKETARGIALLPGGDIILAGDSMNDVFVARYTPSGKPVRTFGSGKGLFAGTVRLDLRGIDNATGVSISPDGRIVVVGTATAPAAGPSRPFATRFNARGRYDRSYGIRGMADLDFADNGGGIGAARLSASSPAPDGSIYLTATSTTRSFGDVAVMRMTPAGREDYPFGGEETLTNVPATVGNIAALRASDGKLMVAAIPRTRDHRMKVTRFNPDGSPDAIFGDAGSVWIEFPAPFKNTSYSPYIDLAEDSAGRFVIAAESYRYGPDEAAPCIQLARLAADGTLDLTFGSSGFAVLPLGALEFVRGLGIATLGNSVLLATATESAELILAKFDAAGQLDASFGTAGMARFDIGARVPPAPAGSLDNRTYATLSDMLIDAAGRIHVIGRMGRIYPFGWSGELFDARFDAEGHIDAGFAAQGLFKTALASGAIATAAAFLPDGRIVLAGALEPTSGEVSMPRSTAVLMLRQNGTLDPAFGDQGSGIKLLPLADDTMYFEDVPSAVQVTAEGQLLLAGTARGSDEQFKNFISLTLTRLTLAGQLDGAWGVSGRVLGPVLDEPSGEVVALLDAASNAVFVTPASREIALTRFKGTGV